MRHIIELVNCNIVIVANSFNTSLINPVWLYKNGIFSEEELNGATSIPGMIEIQSPQKFTFNLIPDRLQFLIDPAVKDKKELILEKLSKFIETLPHTPYNAVGLNFVFHVTPANNIEEFGKSLFFNKNSELHKALDNNHPRLGAYFSTDKLGGRLKLDIKPIGLKISKNELIEKMQFAYNFNFNIDQEEGAKKVIEVFEKWDEAHHLSDDITSKINHEA